MTSITQIAPRAHRRDLFWIAALVHRVSGVLLACFLPVHFLVLALVLTDKAGFDGFIAWTERPLVQAAEAVLVFLLTVHLLGGLRLLLIEYAAWRPGRKEIVALSFGTAAIVALAFYIGVR
jgi:succinate dehydrogenase subunit D